MSRFARFVTAIGWGDGKGQASFNKQVTFTALWVWAGLCAVVGAVAWATRTYPPAALIATLTGLGGLIVGAGFGLKGFSVWAKQRTEAVSVTEQSTTHTDVAAVMKEAGAILQRRSADLGAEATE